MKDMKYKQSLYVFPSPKTSLDTFLPKESFLLPSSSSVDMQGETQLCARGVSNGGISNGSISKASNGTIKSSYSCAQHSHRRYFTEQGTQTVKTFKSRHVRRNSFCGEVGTNSFKSEKS